MILFLGSNPSNAANSTTPFHWSSKSGKTLRKWISDTGIAPYQCLFYNVANRRTPNNRALSKKEIKAAVPALINAIEYEKMIHREKIWIVAVGKTATEAMKMIGDRQFFEWPHPSGMNRQLNDPEFIKGIIKGLSIHLGLLIES